MNERQGCAIVLLLLILFLGITLAVQGSELGFLILAAFAIVIVRIIYEGKKTQEAAQKNLGNEALLCSATAELIGGNHPLLGSSQRAVILAVSQSNLAIAGEKIPLVQVRAHVATQSAVSSMGIFLFGLLALGAKDKVLVLEFDDPVSKEHYNSVFKGINNPELIADTINRQRYFLLSKAEPQRETQE
ncbi:MAG: hypothetical protein D9V47_00075 [Clostridia bacterium]|nr:MAG: hypothetical protein D9V47_00075 [Clostridia bacterium]